MHRRLPVAAALALSLAAALPAAAANRGIPHLVGDKETTAIQPVTDSDTFVFDAPLGASLSITVKAAKGAALLPTLALTRPDGSPVPLGDLQAAKYAPGKTSAKIVKFPVTESGKWAVTVAHAGEGTGGTYTLSSKIKYPKPLKAKGVTLVQGQPLDIPLGLANGTAVTLSLKRKSGGILTLPPQVRTGAGGVVSVPASLWTVSEKGITGKKVPIISTFGPHVLRLQGPTSGGDAVVDYTLSVAWPARKPTARTVSSLEPTITAVAPSVGNQGTQIQVTGTNFLEGASIEVGGAAASNVFRAITGTTMTGVVPAGSGTVAVTVYNADGQSGSSPAAFTYLPPPSVTSVFPTSGPSTGGTPLTITGANFRTGSSVFLGTTPISGIVVANATTITCTTPGLPSGTYAVEVRDSTGAFAVLPGAFTFLRTLTPSTGALQAGVSAGTLASAGLLFDADNDSRADDMLLTSPVEVPLAGGGGFEPATRFLRGNNNLTISDLTSGSFPAPWWPTIKNFDTTLNSGTDYGLGHAVAVGDLDGDGDQDAVVTFDGAFAMSNYFFFLYPSACGGAPIPSPQLPNYAYYPLVYPGSRIFLNSGSGTFTHATVTASTGGAVTAAWPVFTQGILWGEWFQGSAVAIGDMDRDGDQDVVLVTNGGAFPMTRSQYLSGACSLVTGYSTALRVLSNNGNATFVFSMGVTGTLGEPFHGRALALANLDGPTSPDLEIIVGTDSVPVEDVEGEIVPLFATRIIRNDGSNLTPDRFALPQATALDDGRCHALAVADVDGDGDPDIVITTPDPLEDAGQDPVATKSSTRILINDGGGTFTDQTAARMPALTATERWQAHGLALGDLDGDGDRDLCLLLDGAIPDPSYTVDYAPSLRVLTNNGSGVFSKATAGFVPGVDLDAPTGATPDFRHGSVILLGDLDDDGDRDLILGTAYPLEGIPEEASVTRALRVIENR
jgi:hypothetical protein